MTTDDLPPDPDDPEPDPVGADEASDLDFADMPCTDAGDSECSDGDDSRWEVFLADEYEADPAPDRGDFWLESDSNIELWTHDS